MFTPKSNEPRSLIYDFNSHIKQFARPLTPPPRESDFDGYETHEIKWVNYFMRTRKLFSATGQEIYWPSNPGNTSHLPDTTIAVQAFETAYKEIFALAMRQSFGDNWAPSVMVLIAGKAAVIRARV